jgi:hypothetical protein
MPQTIPFHLDEHIPDAIANGLRLRGADVTTTDEAGLRGATDEEQLRHALAAGRVIFTCDPDFIALHHAGVEHAGIAYTPQQHLDIGDAIRGLMLIWDYLDPPDMYRKIEYL